MIVQVCSLEYLSTIRSNKIRAIVFQLFIIYALCELLILMTSLWLYYLFILLFKVLTWEFKILSPTEK